VRAECEIVNDAPLRFDNIMQEKLCKVPVAGDIRYLGETSTALAYPGFRSSPSRNRNLYEHT